MNKEAVRKVMNHPAFNAWLNNEPLQWRSILINQWIDVAKNNIELDLNVFIDSPGRVRIKPAPQEFWLVLHLPPGCSRYESKEAASEASRVSGYPMMHVMEIQD